MTDKSSSKTKNRKVTGGEGDVVVPPTITNVGKRHQQQKEEDYEKGGKELGVTVELSFGAVKAGRFTWAKETVVQELVLRVAFGSAVGIVVGVGVEEEGNGRGKGAKGAA